MVRVTRDLPDFPAASTARPLKERARENGHRVLLTGLGGDEWLSGSDLHYADLLRSFRWFRLAGELVGRRAVPWVGFSPARVLRSGIRPLLLDALPSGVRQRLRQRRAGSRPFPWIPSAFFRRARLDERLRAAAPPPWPTHAQRDVWAANDSGFLQHVLEVEERYTAHLGLEQRHPLLDRRIVELALALPEEQRWRGSVTKFVLREAMRGLLPEAVRTRRSKASLGHTLPRALLGRGDAPLFLDSSSARNGWIDGAVAERMYGEMSRQTLRDPWSPAPHALRLWMMYSVEVWANGWRCRTHD
jgi:asparagine synthase (glutamine-hydrolysing)